MRTVSGAQQSAASNEVAALRAVAQTPSAPASLLGFVNGSSLGLTWRTTYTGGAPTWLMLDVTGRADQPRCRSASARPSNFDGVPPGSYRSAVRR